MHTKPIYVQGVAIPKPYSLWVRHIGEPDSRVHTLLYNLLLVLGAAAVLGEHLRLQLKVHLAEILQTHVA